MSEPGEVERRIEAIDGLVREIERVTNPATKSLAKRLVQSLMDLHGAGLGRMLEIVHRTGEQGQRIIDEMGGDELARTLLLLYGMHPLNLETRVLQAVQKTRPYLRSQGGDVELIRVSDAGAVTLRLDGSRHGCSGSTATLQSAIEQAIYEAAPDVTAIAVEGAMQQQSSASFLPLSTLQRNGNSHSQNPSAGAPEQAEIPEIAIALKSERSGT